ncbi:MAG: SIR2 family protein [Syntrophomonadaceae bacterium]|nr:SIR2 family protein [Syntrophomonadaceae bacterium]
MHIEGKGNCECKFCMQQKSFDLPKETIEAAKRGDLVIFSGAGVSTESRTVYNHSLYEDVKYELGITENLSFSKLMSKYCNNTNGRINLLKKIKCRFDYVSSFPELQRRASSFHRELSSIYMINEIITTNWDDLFERYCGAIPIVTPEDFVFWNLPERKVLKIHGSINNFGSIIATEEDYNKCYNTLNTGLIGSSLKMMLATKYVIFCGYSFGDEDFNSIYNSLLKEMNGLMPHAYIVTLDDNALEKFRDINLTPIITDATYFVSNLKNILIDDSLIIPDEILDSVPLMLHKVQTEHDLLSAVFNIKEHPEVVFSLCYQDGLIHAFERIMARRNTGEYSDPYRISRIINSYFKWKSQKLKKKLYHDVAYMEGYINGLTYLLIDDERGIEVPVYFLFGYKSDILTLDEYKNIIEGNQILHKASFKHTQKIVSSITNDSSEMVFHHTPFL